jgi:hypothetical protein
MSLVAFLTEVIVGSPDAAAAAKRRGAGHAVDNGNDARPARGANDPVANPHVQKS